MAKKKYQDSELFGPAPTPSLASRLGSGAISGISAVGNLLDLPGSSLRDIAVGKNPVDQYLSPFSSKNRTSGRDLLRSYGMAGKKDTWGNFGAGLAVDIASDPLTYLTFGGSALGKFGKVAKAAGIHGDEAARIFNKASRVLPGTFGKRSARLGLTGEMIQQHAPEAFSRLQNVSKAQGFDLLNNMQEPMGGLAKFWPTGSLLGTGDSAKGVARYLDKAGDAVRYAKIPGTNIAPVRDIENLFTASRYGAPDTATSQMAKGVFNKREEARAGVRLETARFAHVLKDMGFDDSRAAELGTYLQYPKQAPAHMQGLIGEIRQMFENHPQQFKEIGGILGQAQDKMHYAGSDALYKPRAMTENIVKGTGQGANSRSFSGFTPHSFRRWAWTHGVRGGDEVLQEMGKYVQELIDMGMTKVDDVATELESKFGQHFDPLYIPGPRGKGDKDLFTALRESKKYRYAPTVTSVQDLLSKGKKRFRGAKLRLGETFSDAAKSLMSLSPEVRNSGVWGNFPLADIMHASLRNEDALVAMRGVMEHLTELGKLDPARLASGAGKVSMRELLPQLRMTAGDRTGGAAKWYYKQVHGIDLAGLKKKDAAKHIQAFKNLAVDADTAKFLTQMKEGFDAPDAVKGIVGIYDKFNNLTKALYTSAKPSFHGRNVPSGQFNNLLAEQNSWNSFKAALDVAAGKDIQGASQVPIIQQEAARRGIQNLDDAEATKIVREWAYAHEMTGNAGASLPTHPTHVGGSLNDILGDVPGATPFRFGDVAGKLTGRQGTTWNPFKAQIRGVNTSAESTFAPVAAGEMVGNASEHLNRFAPFYELLKQGVDPAEAARRVGEAQVQYQNRFYTKTEQQVMQRLMLFYKFFKGQVPFTLRQLAENPGGRLAQTLRAINRSRDEEDNIPGWIKETASIPLEGIPGMEPKEPGAKRYFTGLGLAFEDPIQFATPSLQNAGLETLSRMNPVLKGPLEYATGQSFFQKGGPHGGRPLEDLDPLLGRTITNIENLAGIYKGKEPARYPGSDLMEHVLSNSPLATSLGMLRTATDPRKGLTAKASNLLTGLKITDVSPAAQDRELRQKVSQIEKQLGGRVYVDSYLPQEAKDQLTPKEKLEYERLQALRRLLEARSKERKATQKK